MEVLDRRSLRMAVTALALLACAAPQSQAQGVTAPALKAAFVVNFAKFADWPEDVVSLGAQFRFCVLGAPAVAAAVRALVAQQQRKGPGVIVATLAANAAEDPTELRSCQILYISGFDRNRMAGVLDSIAGASILTVSDLDGFARIGGVAELYFEDDRMRFAINVESAQRARLRLGAPLLTLARVVKDARP
ncbi:MAG TPA: YfiR family protein [Vicinamibacterales bacterium]|nr:YfiR family protein [Vicinamibacterales bacterium]